MRKRKPRKRRGPPHPAHERCTLTCRASRARVSPVILDGAFGEAQRLGGFQIGQAHEITQLENLGLNNAGGGGFIECLVHGEQLILISGCRNFKAGQVNALLVAALTHSPPAAGLVNENAAHGFGRGGEAKRAVLNLGIRLADQPQPGLMHQRGGLQGLMGRFAGHFGADEVAQLSIHQRQQSLVGLGIAVLGGLKDAVDVARSAAMSRFARVAPENWAAPCGNAACPPPIAPTGNRLGRGLIIRVAASINLAVSAFRRTADGQSASLSRIHARDFEHKDANAQRREDFLTLDSTLANHHLDALAAATALWSLSCPLCASAALRLA